MNPTKFLKAEEIKSEKDVCLPLKFSKQEYKDAAFAIYKDYKKPDKLLIHYRLMYLYFKTYFKFVDDVKTRDQKAHRSFIRILSLFTFRRVISNIKNVLIYEFATLDQKECVCNGIMFACLALMENQSQFLCDMGKYFLRNVNKYNNLFVSLAESGCGQDFFSRKMHQHCMILKAPEGNKLDVIEMKSVQALIDFFIEHSEEMELCNQWFYKVFGYFETPFTSNFYFPKVS